MDSFYMRSSEALPFYPGVMWKGYAVIVDKSAGKPVLGLNHGYSGHKADEFEKDIKKLFPVINSLVKIKGDKITRWEIAAHSESEDLKNAIISAIKSMVEKAEEEKDGFYVIRRGGESFATKQHGIDAYVHGFDKKVPSLFELAKRQVKEQMHEDKFYAAEVIESMPTYVLSQMGPIEKFENSANRVKLERILSLLGNHKYILVGKGRIHQGKAYSASAYNVLMKINELLDGKMMISNQILDSIRWEIIDQLESKIQKKGFFGFVAAWLRHESTVNLYKEIVSILTVNLCGTPCAKLGRADGVIGIKPAEAFIAYVE
ncbi:hypothetical protein FNU76_19395 [Chitinimonas arctica]|uniref:Uncharacterized protein n=1 Tax=Chitinimonas arctica TaxID=2594795 RepID=A0A516SJK8_9NEIS|nr:hypothetical protein [Chitinimonas arctica]QDQ28341.1 hypothetical protein FNU76_19395 [Chitinimonas arctica]